MAPNEVYNTILCRLLWCKDIGEKWAGEEEEEEENEEPLSLEWPETRRKQATYLLLLPIIFPLWLTVPDVRNPVRAVLIYAL